MNSSAKALYTPRVLIAFACVYLFWGSTYVAIRFGVAVLSPYVLASVRFLIAGPLMLGLCAARGLRLRQTPRDLARLAVIGILMLGLGNLGLVWCEQYLSSGLAALLIAVVPLYVALAEALLPDGESLPGRGWLGVGIGFGGLLILLWPALHTDSGAHAGLLAGTLVALGSALAWTAGSLYSRRSKLGISPFVAAAWEMLFAGLFNWLILTGTGGSLRRVHWTPQAGWSVAWLVAFGSLVGYTAYIYLLANVPVAKVATYAYINPLVAVVLGAVLLGERMQRVEYAGMAVILLAVYLVTGAKLRGSPAPVPSAARTARAEAVDASV